MWVQENFLRNHFHIHFIEFVIVIPTLKFEAKEVLCIDVIIMACNANIG